MDDKGSSEPEEQGNKEDKEDNEGTYAPSSAHGLVASLEQSQSTASLASQGSGAISTTVTAEEAWRTKFDAHFKTATSTNEEVLGQFYHLFNKIIFSSFVERQMAVWTSPVY